MPPRKSSRIKSQVQPVRYEEESDADAEYEQQQQQQPAEASSSKPLKRKRKAVASPPPASKGKAPASTTSTTIVGVKEGGEAGRPAKKLRGKRGILQQLAEMPLELLFEIFGQLDPIDLLNLSRSTKALRAILLRKSSADIWRGALANVAGLPPCPSDLNEAQWSNLLFGRNCYFCGRAAPPLNQTYAWEARVRGCYKCVIAQFPKDNYTVILSRPILELVPTLVIRRAQGRRHERGPHYHEETYEKFVEIEKRLTNVEERGKWFAERRAEKDRIAAHAKVCEVWERRRGDARQEELKDLKALRRATLRDKLEDLGSSSTLVGLAFNNRDFWSASCVSNIMKKDITDRVWASAEGAIDTLMVEFQRKHAKEEREQFLKPRFKQFEEAYEAYVKTRPRDELIIPIGDLFLVPEVKRIVLEEPVDAPLDMDLLDSIWQNVQTYTTAWRAQASDKLVGLMKPEAAALGLKDIEDMEHEEILGLALSVFECHRCYGSKRLMHAERALWHSCAMSAPYSYHIPASASDDMKVFVKHVGKAPWDYEGKIFKFSAKSAQRAREIANRLKLDPTTTTIEELDALDPIFERPSEGAGREMSTWRGILGVESYPLPVPEFSVLDEKTSAIMRERFDEDLRRERGTEKWSLYLFCTHCRGFSGPSGALRTHLNKTHGIRVASDKDVWIHPDAPFGRLDMLYHKRHGATVI